MKIRNRHLIRATGWTATMGAKGLLRTLRNHYLPLGPSLRPADAAPGARHIYSIWHENLLLPALTFGCRDLAVLISGHADGQLLGALITSMGMGMVHGSSTRGGIDAVRKLTRPDFPYRHLAVTPDGPRGPRRVVQPGIVYVASRTGMTIIPVGVGYHAPWRAGSWDRFALPKPFTRACCVVSEPVAVPPDLKADGLEAYRLKVQAEMDRLNAVAEAYAETGRVPAPPAATAPPLKLAS